MLIALVLPNIHAAVLIGLVCILALAAGLTWLEYHR